MLPNAESTRSDPARTATATSPTHDITCWSVQVSFVITVAYKVPIYKGQSIQVFVKLGFSGISYSSILPVPNSASKVSAVIEMPTYVSQPKIVIPRSNHEVYRTFSHGFFGIPGYVVTNQNYFRVQIFLQILDI